MHRRLFAVVCLVVIASLATDICQAQSNRARQRNNQRNNQRKAAPTSPRGNLPKPDDEARQPVTIAGVDPYSKQSVLESAERIDSLVERQLQRNGQTRNPQTTDSQFVRRIYLDVVGTIPTGRQTFSFLNSKDPDKRSKLIDSLLNRPGYASHLYNFFADLLRIVDKSAPNTYTRPYGDWVKESLRDNKSYQRMVYELLTAEGKPWDNPAVGYKMRDRGMPLDNLNNTVRVFLGTRIGCAQCHDHPFDRWTQREFYELAAFEGGIRGTVSRKQFKLPIEAAERLVNGPAERWIKRLDRYNREQVFERTNFRLKFPHDYAYDDAKPGQVVSPDVIFGESPALARGSSRREAFAEWLTGNENPRFAATIANRLWRRAFGIGVIEPVDDLRDETRGSNPELLEYLVNEMKRVEFDLKEFQRIIYHTRTYQSQVSYQDLDPEEEYHFAGPLLRRMTAEQVWDSLLTLTLDDPDGLLRPQDEDFVEALDVEPGATADELASKAKMLTEIEKERRQQDRRQTYRGAILRRASELPQPLPDGHFLRQFGQSERQIISASNTDGTVPQLLTLFNGPVTHMMLEEGSVIHREVTKAEGVTNRVKIIFLSVLGRLPTTSDRTRAASQIREHRNAGYGDVIWALLNTREFLFIQ